MVQVADLPFYDEYKLYTLSDTTLPPPNTRYMLYKPGDVSLMNWTNEPIYSVNERAPIKIDRKTCLPYANSSSTMCAGNWGASSSSKSPKKSVARECQ